MHYGTVEPTFLIIFSHCLYLISPHIYRSTHALLSQFVELSTFVAFFKKNHTFSVNTLQQLKSRNQPVNVATPSPVIYWKRAVVPKVGIEIRCKG